MADDKKDDPVINPVINIEPFDPKKHDRAAFSCGSERIDNYLKQSAKKHQKGDFTRVWVAVAPEEAKLFGYYAVNAHGIEGADLPEALTKHAPGHGFVPAGYISMIGVDQTQQGKGLGRILLFDALKRFAAAADEIGVAVAVLDILDEGGAEAVDKRRKFYEGMGFQAFPTNPMRMFIPIKTVRAVIGK